MRVSLYCFLGAVLLTLPIGEFTMGTAFAGGIASAIVQRFSALHWLAVVTIGTVLHRNSLLIVSQLAFALFLFVIQKQIVDINVAHGYLRPWDAGQAFLTFCACLFASMATSLPIAWVASLMYPAKPNSGSNDAP